MSELAERRAERDLAFMRQALALAASAPALGEVPVAALVVRQQQIIASGHNRNYLDADPSAHAEIVAMRAAGAVLRNPRLNDCTLYVTLEPCVMCVGAILHARIARLVFAAYDPKAGACGTAIDALRDAAFNHRVELTSGVLADESNALLKAFFAQRR
jgi:tRNA(adenine34) deaminase